jgi:hypothetical protein
MIDALSEGRHISQFENRYIRADGAVRWLQWNTRAMPEKGLMYAAARDVTENRMLTHEAARTRGTVTRVWEERTSPARLSRAAPLHGSAAARAGATARSRWLRTR